LASIHALLIGCSVPVFLTIEAVRQQQAGLPRPQFDWVAIVGAVTGRVTVPLVVVVALRQTGWPQLLRPVAVLVAGLIPVPAVVQIGSTLLGLAIGNRPAGADQVQAVAIVCSGVDPVNLVLTVWGLYLGRRCWRLGRDYQAITTARAPLRRRLAASATAVVAGLYLVASAGLAATAGWVAAGGGMPADP
jgi:hypothetical protein